jgi:hypothetical protein
MFLETFCHHIFLLADTWLSFHRDSGFAQRHVHGAAIVTLVVTDRLAIAAPVQQMFDDVLCYVLCERSNDKWNK